MCVSCRAAGWRCRIPFEAGLAPRLPCGANTFPSHAIRLILCIMSTFHQRKYIKNQAVPDVERPGLISLCQPVSLMLTDFAAECVAQSGELGEAEASRRARAHRAAGGDGRRGARLVAAGHTGQERVDERLAPLIERRAHDSEQQPLSCTATGGALRTCRRTTVLVTFGAGTKQCGGTSNSSSGSACHCTNTVSAP